MLSWGKTIVLEIALGFGMDGIKVYDERFDGLCIVIDGVVHDNRDGVPLIVVSSSYQIT